MTIFKKHYLFLIIVFFHLFLLINIRYTLWPEMILYPWLLNKGYFLYKDIINPYFPLLTLVLGGFLKLFGVKIITIKLFTYLVILVNDLVIYWSVTKFSKRKSTALLSVFLYSILQISYGGNALWFELVLVPFIIAGVALLFSSNLTNKSTLLIGFLLTFAILIKQNAILFLIPFGYFYLIKKQYKKILILVMPSLLAFLILFIFLNNFGIWDSFWLWAIRLPLTYTSQPGFVSMPAIRQYPFIIFPGLAIVAFLISKKEDNLDKIFWLMFLGISLIFAFPRYEDFHLQVYVAVSILFIRFMPSRFLIAYFLITVLIFSSYLVKYWHKDDRFLEKNIYEFSEIIAKYPSVYLMNSPDIEYFLADKLPPRPWAANFPWYFNQEGFEARFIEGLKTQKPNAIIVGDPIGGGKYALGNYLPEKVVEYVHQNYFLAYKYKNYKIWQIKLI